MSPLNPDVANEAATNRPANPTAAASNAIGEKRPGPNKATNNAGTRPSTPVNNYASRVPTAIMAPGGKATAGTTALAMSGRVAPIVARPRQKRPNPSPSSGDSDSTGTYTPPKKITKVTPAKETSAKKKVPVQKPAPANSAPANSPAGPRPRGRPPGGGIPRKNIRLASTTAGETAFKAESPASSDNMRRLVKSKTNTKLAKPWTLGPEADRRFTSDDLGLLETGMFHDATVTGIKKEWKVHKTILCTRSKWFNKAFTDGMGQTNVVNLSSYEPGDVETLLKFVYSGALDKDEYKIEQGSFIKYTRLFNLGETFELETLSNDALSLLGQFCDQKLVAICSYDVSKSGRQGVIDTFQNSPDQYIDDLLKAIVAAYDVPQPTRLQALLASFVWAGRDRLLRCKEFVELTRVCVAFGNDMFKLMLGQNDAHWLPSVGAAHDLCVGFDHSRKTQHPDRCEKCEEVFDEDQIRKALYNPFKAAVRAAAWCAPCVEGNKGGAPLWRLVAEEGTEE